MDSADLQIIINATEEGLILVDAERNIVQLNSASEEILGAGLRTQPFVRAIRHPDVLACLSQVLEGQQRATTNVHLTNPLPATYRVSVVHLGDNLPGEPIAAVTMKDVSPLLEAAQMRSDFVANVSHELRSPLTTLSGMIETLQGSAKDDPDARERFLNIMGNEAGRMDRLIGDLLSLSKVESDERVRPTEIVDLIPIIRRVIAVICERADASGRKIIFNPGVERSDIRGDSDQLTQVFHNLIENSIKYSKPGGQVVIKLDYLESAPHFSQPVWTLSVDDQGDGIAPEHIPRLSERFYRVDSGRSRELGGTGLGLAIVKHILSRHRGRMVIQSQLGTGTTVAVTLPALT